MTVKLIIASDINGGIGYQNRLPWKNIQGDLARFKKLTTNHTVIMGRNTWDSLPKKPLPDRTNIVVSSRPLEDEYPNVICSPDMTFNRPDDLEFWLIGGAKLIESCWELVDEIHLTKTFAQFSCDTFIDLLYIESRFRCVSTETHDDHTYSVYIRN